MSRYGERESRIPAKRKETQPPPPPPPCRAESTSACASPRERMCRTRTARTPLRADGEHASASERDGRRVGAHECERDERRVGAKALHVLYASPRLSLPLCLVARFLLVLCSPLSLSLGASVSVPSALHRSVCLASLALAHTCARAHTSLGTSEREREKERLRNAQSVGSREGESDGCDGERATERERGACRAGGGGNGTRERRARARARGQEPGCRSRERESEKIAASECRCGVRRRRRRDGGTQHTTGE